MLISRDAACCVRLKNAPRRMPRKQIFCSATPLAETACFAPSDSPVCRGRAIYSVVGHSFGFILAHHPPTSSKPKPIELALIAEASQMFSMRSMINLKSQTSCKPRAIELALIAEAQPMFIMRSMINLKSQTSNLKPTPRTPHSRHRP